MNRFKRAGLLALQLLVVLVTVAATVTMLVIPGCIDHVLAEVGRGLSAGLLLASVKALGEISQPKMACKSVWCWCRCWGAGARQELKCGLVAGYLLGLALVIWFCWIG